MKVEERQRAIWPLFVRAALWLAASAGFSLGAALFAAPALGLTTGSWWAAAAQAHGHIQLFGWTGLTTVGVGLHFLPRLRGSALAHPTWARYAAWLLIAGLALRAVAQPVLAAVAGGAAATAVHGPLIGGPLIGALLIRALLIGSGVLECLGAAAVLLVLAGTLRSGAPLRTRAALWSVLPFFALGFLSLGTALCLNLAGVTAAALGAGTPDAAAAMVPAWIDTVTNRVALYGFLLPVAIAMSARTFPLFFRTLLPAMTPLRAGLVLLLAGLVLRSVGDLESLPAVGVAQLAGPAAGIGQLAMAAAIIVFLAALGIFGPRRPLPRQPVRPLRDPIEVHAVSAYLWLALAAVILARNGLVALGAPLTLLPEDAERHAVGAGFLTILILGIGAEYLPGFAGRRLRSRAILWATALLGNLTAVLRVAPLLFPTLFGSAESWTLAAAGVTALLALLLFAVNVPTSTSRPAPNL